MIKRDALNENMKEITKTLDFLKIKRNSLIMDIENQEQKRHKIIMNLKRLEADLNEVKGKTKIFDLFIR